MSIARDEAERLYPIHRAGDDRVGFIQPAIDVLSQNAYARGRTAEPCREQVEAVARMLFEEPWRKGESAMTFDEYVEARRGFEDEHVAKYMSVARMLLEAARDAVDEGDEECESRVKGHAHA